MKLTDFLNAERVVLDFEAKTREEVVAHLLAPVINGYDRATVRAAILEREKLGTTGIGYGVAVPHIRIDAVEQPVVVFGRSTRPVDFDAVDGAPCRLFFLILGPTRKDGQEPYLHAMAKISRLMRNAEMRESLLRAATPAAVMALVTERT